MGNTASVHKEVLVLSVPSNSSVQTASISSAVIDATSVNVDSAINASSSRSDLEPTANATSVFLTAIPSSEDRSVISDTSTSVSSSVSSRLVFTSTLVSSASSQQTARAITSAAGSSVPLPVVPSLVSSSVLTSSALPSSVLSSLLPSSVLTVSPFSSSSLGYTTSIIPSSVVSSSVIPSSTLRSVPQPVVPSLAIPSSALSSSTDISSLISSAASTVVSRKSSSEKASASVPSSVDRVTTSPSPGVSSVSAQFTLAPSAPNKMASTGRAADVVSSSSASASIASTAISSGTHAASSGTHATSSDGPAATSVIPSNSQSVSAPTTTGNGEAGDTSGDDSGSSKSAVSTTAAPTSISSITPSSPPSTIASPSTVGDTSKIDVVSSQAGSSQVASSIKVTIARSASPLPSTLSASPSIVPASVTPATSTVVPATSSVVLATSPTATSFDSSSPSQSEKIASSSSNVGKLVQSTSVPAASSVLRVSSQLFQSNSVTFESNTPTAEHTVAPKPAPTLSIVTPASVSFDSLPTIAVTSASRADDGSQSSIKAALVSSVTPSPAASVEKSVTVPTSFSHTTQPFISSVVKGFSNVQANANTPPPISISTITDQPETTLSSPVFITVTDAHSHTTLSEPPIFTSIGFTTLSDGVRVSVTHVIANPTGIWGVQDTSNSGFFHNSGAVAGVFATVGVVVTAALLLGLFFIYRGRRRRTIRSSISRPLPMPQDPFEDPRESLSPTPMRAVSGISSVLESGIGVASVRPRQLLDDEYDVTTRSVASHNSNNDEELSRNMSMTGVGPGAHAERYTGPFADYTALVQASQLHSYISPRAIVQAPTLTVITEKRIDHTQERSVSRASTPSMYPPSLPMAEDQVVTPPDENFTPPMPSLPPMLPPPPPTSPPLPPRSPLRQPLKLPISTDTNVVGLQPVGLQSYEPLTPPSSSAGSRDGHETSSRISLNPFLDVNSMLPVRRNAEGNFYSRNKVDPLHPSSNIEWKS